MAHTVVFVCPHGALKSRLAAAFFNKVAPQGWRATSAGLQPQEQVSVHAEELLAGTDAAGLLEMDSPRALVDLPAPALVVAIDCEVRDAEHWELANGEAGVPMRDELHLRVEQLVRTVGNGRG